MYLPLSPSPSLFLHCLYAAVVSVVWCLLSWRSEPMPDVIVNFERGRESRSRPFCCQWFKWNTEMLKCSPHKASPSSCYLYFFWRKIVNLPWGYTAFCSVKYKRFPRICLKSPWTCYQRRNEMAKFKTYFCFFNKKKHKTYISQE